jgi:4-hydroxybenzoate polyprenyltransferase
MEKSIAKFILITTLFLVLGIVGMWLFNHVNSWVGVLSIIALIISIAFAWSDVAVWVTKNNNNQEEKYKK